jgi:metallo-beta-lactamase class B
MSRALAALAVSITSVVFAIPRAAPQQPPEWTARIPPFKVIANIYYVGTKDLAAWLVTSRGGHVLIDGGVERNADAILGGIRSLGFNPREVKVLLTTQAHFDHVGSLAALKRATGGRVLASEKDAAVLRAGGKNDYHFGGDRAFWFPPVAADGTLADGQVVRVGDIALTAHLTPGHTPGTLSYTMDVRDRLGRQRHVAFMGSTAVNPGVKLVGNAKYPGIADDFQRTFQVQRALPCDVWLTAHLSAINGLTKIEKAHAGAGEDAFVDPQGCRAAITRSQQAFTDELNRQRAEAKGIKR